MNWRELGVKTAELVHELPHIDLKPLEARTDAAHDTLAHLAGWVAEVEKAVHSWEGPLDAKVTKAVAIVDSHIADIKSILESSINTKTESVRGQVAQLEAFTRTKVTALEADSLVLHKLQTAVVDRVEKVAAEARERAEGVEHIIAAIQVPQSPAAVKNWTSIAALIAALAAIALHFVPSL